MSEAAETDARWNPRYVAYASSEGLTPKEILAKDKERWPGGHMAGFMSWVRRHWEMWDRAQGHSRARCDERPDSDYTAFTAWLLEKYPAPVVGEQLKLL